MSSLSRKEAGTQGALMAATARADAAEKRVSQLEKEADGLAREVGMLQVGKEGCRARLLMVCAIFRHKYRLFLVWALLVFHVQLALFKHIPHMHMRAGKARTRGVQPLRQCACAAPAHES